MRTNYPKSNRTGKPLRVWDAVERIPTERWRLWIAFLKTERSLMFAYVRLKSLMFAYFEKKYFFPALWSSFARTQWVGGCRKWSAGVLEYWGTRLQEAARIFVEKITDFLASQARHEMGAQVELFAGAKRG